MTERTYCKDCGRGVSCPDWDAPDGWCRAGREIMCEHNWIEMFVSYPDQTHPYIHVYWMRCLECNLRQRTIDEENYHDFVSTVSPL